MMSREMEETGLYVLLPENRNDCLAQRHLSYDKTHNKPVYGQHSFGPAGHGQLVSGHPLDGQSAYVPAVDGRHVDVQTTYTPSVGKVATYSDDMYRMSDPRPPNNMIPSVLATLFCCLITGICAISYASKANAAVARRDMERAKRMSNTARNLIITSVVLGTINLTVFIYMRTVSVSHE